ncbi:MAG TPA: hypothetical protein VN704_04625, partial [Verrucomicrobiae bacterium]|nr:hypothetical protein [Verrucomicrobiae bacterium]
MISRTFILIFLASILFFSGVCTYVNAQQPGPVNNNNPSSSISNIISTPKKSIGVRITSPV